MQLIETKDQMSAKYITRENLPKTIRGMKHAAILSLPNVNDLFTDN